MKHSFSLNENTETYYIAGIYKFPCDNWQTLTVSINLLFVVIRPAGDHFPMLLDTRLNH